MFWRFGGYANISAIDTLLEKPDVTLEDLLDESDLIQELKQHNTKLIEYLREDKILERLLEYVVAPKLEPTIFEEAAEAEEKPEVKGKERAFVIAETEDEEKEKKRNRYAYVAAEVLSSDNWSICESLMENQALLRKFWDFLKLPPPLDPLQASYFTKVNEALLDKKTEEMLDLFKSMEGAVKNMLQHVDSPMVMDLLLKIISLEKAEGGAGIVDVKFANFPVFQLLIFAVVTFSRFDADTPLLSFIRALLGNPDIGRGFPESYHHHIRECVTERAILHRPKRAHKTASLETMYREANFGYAEGWKPPHRWGRNCDRGHSKEQFRLRSGCRHGSKLNTIKPRPNLPRNSSTNVCPASTRLYGVDSQPQSHHWRWRRPCHNQEERAQRCFWG